MSRNKHFVSEHLPTNSSQYNVTEQSDGHAQIPTTHLYASGRNSHMSNQTRGGSVYLDADMGLDDIEAQNAISQNV